MGWNINTTLMLRFKQTTQWGRHNGYKLASLPTIRCPFTLSGSSCVCIPPAGRPGHSRGRGQGWHTHPLGFDKAPPGTHSPQWSDCSWQERRSKCAGSSSHIEGRPLTCSSSNAPYQDTLGRRRKVWQDKGSAAGKGEEWTEFTEQMELRQQNSSKKGVVKIESLEDGYFTKITKTIQIFLVKK